MSYVRHDKDNIEKETQPASSSITLYGGDEGWSTLTYKVWNGDNVARNSDNTQKTRGSYQKRDKDNNPISPSLYQRHDYENNLVEQ